MLQQSRQRPDGGVVVADSGAAGGKVRVLHVGPLPPPIGGMATFMQGYLRSDVARNFRVFVVRTDLLGKYRFTGLTRRVWNVLNAGVLSLAVLGSILLRRPAIVHVETNSFAGFFEKSFLALLASLLGRKVIMHVHGGLFREFYQDACRLGKWLIRRCLAVNDRVVAATPRMRETFEMIGLPSEKVALLANAVDLPAESIWDAARRREGASEGPLTVLYLGRISLQKGLIDLVDAAKRVRERFPQARFRIAGLPSADSEAVRAHVREQALDGTVELAGAVPPAGKAAAFLAADVYVLPSYVEDMPYSLLEAMSYGLPCVATRVGGVPTVIQEGVNGLLVEAGDEAALAGAIERLIGEPDLRRRLGLAARETIEQRFAWKARAAEIGEMYNTLLAGSG